MSLSLPDLQRFRNECVAAHNFYRAAHGTPPLCWSTRLAESAQAWAEQLASTTGSLRYSSAKDVGENLTLLWGSELNGQKITRIWYEEGKHFDYKKPRVNSRTRSFCQVVWEGTRELGAGAAITKHGKQIVVARYFPPMNKKNVARNVKKAKSTRENEQPLTFDTRWSSLYVGKNITILYDSLQYRPPRFLFICINCSRVCLYEININIWKTRFCLLRSWKIKSTSSTIVFKFIIFIKIFKSIWCRNLMCNTCAFYWYARRWIIVNRIHKKCNFSLWTERSRVNIKSLFTCNV